MLEYRKIFPSYDWDDAWLVNQIINLPEILGHEAIGFAKGVPNEEIKEDDNKIRKWIEENIKKCSCLILFCGENMYESKWVKYEIKLARKLRKGRFIIYLKGLKRKDGTICEKGIDPYKYHNLYSSSGYVIKKYNWDSDNGIDNINDWIEYAINRAN